MISSNARVGFWNSAAVRLPDGDIRARGKRAVNAFERHQVAAVVHDRDRAAGAVPMRLRDGGRDGSLGDVECQGVALGQLGRAEQVGRGDRRGKEQFCRHAFSPLWSALRIAGAMAVRMRRFSCFERFGHGVEQEPPVSTPAVEFSDLHRVQTARNALPLAPVSDQD